MSDADGLLEAVPNVASIDGGLISRVGTSLRAHGCALLDTHSDADHERTVFTLVGEPQRLAESLTLAARDVIARADIRHYRGAHPCIGALDVLPIVYLSEAERALARDEALGVANRLAAELELPIFLYGELASAAERRERAYFRDGGIDALGRRLERGEVEPDFGPSHLHPTAGATLVGVRPPLVAFNLELRGASPQLARRIATEIRERSGGLPGVRAIGLGLKSKDAMQVSANIHDPLRVPLRDVVDAVRAVAEPAGAGVAAAELVGLVPAAALDGLDLGLLRDFDPERHILENRIEHG